MAKFKTCNFVKNYFLSSELLQLRVQRSIMSMQSISSVGRSAYKIQISRITFRVITYNNKIPSTELSNLISCFTAVKNHVIRYCEKVYERSGKTLFWSIKNSGEVLNKIKSRVFRATSLSTYDFSTLYTTLPHI